MATTPRPFVVWFTGLSGGGKSTLANGLSQRLQACELAHTVLDGDVLRTGLCADLGFSVADRHENIRRAGHVAKILVEAGLIVLAAFITPLERDRRMVRNLFAPGQFVEVHVDCPLAVCQRRDPKLLYQKARAGLVPAMTGLASPYERPEQPDLRIPTDQWDLETSVAYLWNFLAARYAIDPAPSLTRNPKGRDRVRSRDVEEPESADGTRLTSKHPPGGVDLPLFRHP
ncbi:adenylyl-sulfate kinase [Sulfobacillus thermosulfidooxidans]|uniref:adenylyl-sulfate kinase n=1 Tax=Sulfobacillus thermosulfidooxidans TaxID=28034 RepID=UPI000AF762E0|nr:adenylyl-sulfate kinase [Sulfobacillus thermosulfidooxidans]